LGMLRFSSGLELGPCSCVLSLKMFFEGIWFGELFVAQATISAAVTFSLKSSSWTLRAGNGSMFRLGRTIVGVLQKRYSCVRIIP